MNLKILFLALIWRLGAGSVIGSSGNPTEGNAESTSPPVTTGWAAEDMPDPRYCPSCCGISEPGWICDPDGVLKDISLGGGPREVDSLNRVLWVAANKSVCPCSTGDCFTHDAVILVAVVRKLKNPDGKTTKELITGFAKDLQERWWKADDTECQQEIIVALSLEDEAITTEIGDDILHSKMMSYDDVVLVGGISQALHASYNLVSHVEFLISTYAMYVDHPPPSTTTPLTSPVTNYEHQNVTVAIIQDIDSGATLSPALIAVIVISVIIFVSAIVITLILPFVCHSDKSCIKFKR